MLTLQLLQLMLLMPNLAASALTETQCNGKHACTLCTLPAANTLTPFFVYVRSVQESHG